MGSFHSQTRIFDQVSEELFVKVMNGEPIINEDDNNGKCSRVVSARTGVKGRSRGIIQCLSNIPLEQWNTMEATTNLGEAQHAWNNAQTGIPMGVIESFKK
jgi:hypothetical protein